jgi:hypothetical protein
VSLIALEKTGSYQLAPRGVHTCICNRAIDLGTQESAFGVRPEIILSFELCDAKAVFDKKRGAEPFLASKTYTNSLSQKSNLRRDVESMLGRKLTGSELGGFNLAVLLGRACLLNITHETSKQGREYAKIIGILPLPRGTLAPQQTLPSIKYSVEEGANDTFRGLPQHLQNKIIDSAEWGKRSSETTDETTDDNGETEQPSPPSQPKRTRPHRPVPMSQPTTDEIDEINNELQRAAAADGIQI